MVASGRTRATMSSPKQVFFFNLATQFYKRWKYSRHMRAPGGSHSRYLMVGIYCRYRR